MRVNDDAVDEVLAQHRIIQATLFFNRQQRIGLHQASGEDALAGCRRRVAVGLVNLDPLHTAAGRLLHKDKAAQLFAEYGDIVGVLLQGVGHVDAVINRANGARRCRVPGQPDGLARGAQANGDFGAEGPQLKQGAQLVGAKA